jgi:hypothetical protein
MSMIKLADAPGGARLIEVLSVAVRDLSLLYAGTPDDRAQVHLHKFCAWLEVNLATAVGTATATEVARKFRETVIGRKHEIEAAGPNAAMVAQ